MAFSTKKRRGRPKLARTAHDYGNDRVQARIEKFRHFRGDSSIGHEMSCAGRLMLVGAFDGLELAPEVILSSLLDYQFAYWGQYPGAAQVSDYEREVRFSGGSVAGDIVPDARGDHFDRIDGILRDCGHATRKAVIDVTVDRHWFPDEDAFWAARIINRRVLDKRAEFIRSGKPVPPCLAVEGQVAHDGDEAWGMLDLLRSGAEALARGANPMRRAA